jgi:hypothetical protein
MTLVRAICVARGNDVARGHKEQRNRHEFRLCILCGEGANCFFFQQSLKKQIISRLEVEKKLFKGENPIPMGLLRKAIVLNRIYTEIVV